MKLEIFKSSFGYYNLRTVDGYPTEEMTEYLKTNGYRWSRNNNCWYPATTEAKEANLHDDFVTKFQKRFFAAPQEQKSFGQELIEREQRKTKWRKEHELNNNSETSKEEEKITSDKTAQLEEIIAELKDKIRQDQEIKASQIFEEMNGYIGHTKDFYYDLIQYLYNRSANEKAGLNSNDNYIQSIFNSVANKITSEPARNGFIEKMKQYDNYNIVFDADKINLGSLELSDREGAKEIKEELNSLKNNFDSLVEELSKDKQDFQDWQEQLYDNQKADEFIEQMQVNGGMSETAIQKEIEAEENQRADWTDSEGNPHWFDEEENEMEEYEDETENNSLEQSSLDNAADLLKTMKFNKDNYKELLDLINKISALNGKEQIQIPTEEQIQNLISESEQNPVQIKSEEEIVASEIDENSRIIPFDPKEPIVYGKTILPAFAVLTDGQLRSIENALVKSHDKNKRTYIIDNGTETFELPESTFKTLLQIEQKQTLIANGKTIVFENKERGVQGTIIPEWAIYTQNGLETFKNFVATGYNKADDSYTLTNGNTTLNLPAEKFKEITAPERFENKYDENSPAWKKLCETQYKDFFQTRENTAYNFRHNLSVYCRKEANSPCDAFHLAKNIISKMPKDEQKKTEKLLKQMANKNESTNEVIARIYHEAVKEQPLNEEYIKTYSPKEVIAKTFYDTISENGKNIENDPALLKGNNDYNLKIGSSLKNIEIKTGNLYGRRKNDFIHFEELKVISASKEGNTITLMDSNKSFIKLPRDTVLEHYKEQQLKEIKHEQKNTRRNSMSLSY